MKKIFLVVILLSLASVSFAAPLSYTLEKAINSKIVKEAARCLDAEIDYIDSSTNCPGTVFAGRCYLVVFNDNLHTPFLIKVNYDNGKVEHFIDICD